MMDFFRTTRRKDSGYTVIIGCGRLGASLANAISDKEASVMMVDRDERAFRKLGASYGGLTLAGDATDIAVLRSAEIERAAQSALNLLDRLYRCVRQSGLTPYTLTPEALRSLAKQMGMDPSACNPLFRTSAAACLRE